MQMPSLTDRSAYLVAAFAGAAGWLAITLGEGRREAWDSEWYFIFLLPALAVLVSWLAFLAPRSAWRWAFVPFAAQAVVAGIQQPTGGLLPLGLLVFAVLGALCLVPALVAAWFRRWLDRQRGASA